MLGDRAEQAAFVNGVKAARGAGAQEIVVSDGVVGARRRGQRLAMRPFDLDRRDREKQRAGKIALAPDPGLGDRLLGDHRGHALAELGRAERLDRHEIDRAGDRGLEGLVRKARDALDAGFAGA